MSIKKVSVRGKIIFSSVLFALFCILTVLLKCVDVKPIGPNDSSVGFAALNGAVGKVLQYSKTWLKISDLLGYLALLMVLGFAMLGLYQLVKRKSLKKVDADIFVLGGFYIVVLGFYLFFNFCVINFRPILLGEELEASFPSSHTLLSLSVIGSSIMQFSRRITNTVLRKISCILSVILGVAIIVGRVLSGAHWATDILGSILLSAALLFAYSAAESYVLSRSNLRDEAAKDGYVH